jgi:hypothetical protein
MVLYLCHKIYIFGNIRDRDLHVKIFIFFQFVLYAGDDRLFHIVRELVCSHPGFYFCFHKSHFPFDLLQRLLRCLLLQRLLSCLLSCYLHVCLLHKFGLSNYCKMLNLFIYSTNNIYN